ncbi:MAG: hypothetical protein ACFFHD_05285 [Promethearchaeota archaeon]
MNKLKNPIPEDVALHLCEEIREQNHKKKFNLARWQCWGCMKYSNKKNDIRHRCIFNKEDNRGCHLVNKIYDDRY